MTTRFFRRTAFFLIAALWFAPAALYADGPGDPAPEPTENIVEIAQNGNFNTLVAALKTAGLVETLMGEGPFTVFAPTDEAFSKLPAGTVENLLKPENRDQLVGILTYHVVSGDYRARELTQLDRVQTLQGATIEIDTQGSSVMVNNAGVQSANIDATNGIVHVIDAVLLPPSMH